jgi:hypothetical protein
MTDNELVEEMAQRNLERVRQIANRDEIRGRVVRLYEQLANTKPPT